MNSAKIKLVKPISPMRVDEIMLDCTSKKYNFYDMINERVNIISITVSDDRWVSDDGRIFVNGLSMRNVFDLCMLKCYEDEIKGMIKTIIDSIPKVSWHIERTLISIKEIRAFEGIDPFRLEEILMMGIGLDLVGKSVNFVVSGRDETSYIIKLEDKKDDIQD